MTSLSQVVMKAGAPGVPDFYQGTETWNTRLVDPDNRGAVDLADAADALAAIDAHAEDVGADRCAAELLARWQDGDVKRWVTSRSLRCRRPRARLFAEGSYLAMTARGRLGDHVVAFARRADDEWAIAVAADGGPPTTERVWGDAAVEIPYGGPERWTDALTGREVLATGATLKVAEVFATLPTALLTGPSNRTGGRD
jgi:(1->4)-alpha-D-glucan 1-alpha-D-glucosylmutase